MVSRVKKIVVSHEETEGFSFVSGNTVEIWLPVSLLGKPVKYFIVTYLGEVLHRPQEEPD